MLKTGTLFHSNCSTHEENYTSSWGPLQKYTFFLQVTFLSTQKTWFRQLALEISKQCGQPFVDGTGIRRFYPNLAAAYMKRSTTLPWQGMLHVDVNSLCLSSPIATCFYRPGQLSHKTADPIGCGIGPMKHKQTLLPVTHLQLSIQCQVCVISQN